MKVLALVPNQLGHAPGQRGSIELWESVLNPEGIELEYAPFETRELQEILYRKGSGIRKATEMMRAYAGRLGLLSKLDEYDAVFVYREAALLGPAFLERRIARRKPIIYQLDDPLFIPYRSPSNGYLSYLKFFGKIKEIIRISTVVMVNSTHIREYAEQFNPNIVQVPSVVDTDKFKFEPEKLASESVIGWSGSRTTVGNLKLVEGALRRLSETRTCRMHFIGGLDFGLTGVDCTTQEWSESTEVEDLRKMNIGLVPLPDAPWNPYKFIMKTAQYMALGIVPVGTPMASNPEVITHGENGFLAANEDEWFDYLGLLANDAELRSRLSRSAAKTAREKYSLEANRGKVVEAFKSAVRN